MFFDISTNNDNITQRKEAPLNDKQMQVFWKVIEWVWRIIFSLYYVLGIWDAQYPFLMFLTILLFTFPALIQIFKVWTSWSPFFYTFGREGTDLLVKREYILYAALICFPFRVYALGTSRFALVYYFLNICANCGTFWANPKQAILRSFMYSAVYMFSPAFQIQDLICSIHVQLIFITTYCQLGQQSVKLQRLYYSQSLHMSSIYHEIKTPLNGIVCATDLICCDMNQLKAHRINIENAFFSIYEWLNVIKTSSLSLTEMVENMLTHSKLQTSKLKLDLSPVMIEEIIQSLKQITSSYPRFPNVRLIFDTESCSMKRVLAHRTSLHQVLVNLMTNALKFTSVGEVKLTTRYLIHTNKVTFEVKDTGIGMNQSFIDNGLFQEFEQEEKMIGNQRGLGLGMSLSKYMIDAMNGEISVQSTKGVGSTFSITLPCVIDELTPLNISTVPPPATSTNFNQSSTTLVNALIVDDNLVNRRVMSQLLKHIGFVCSLAESGEQAIEIVKTRRNELDVIFMDIFMPGMDGIEATRRIRYITSKWKFSPLIVGCTADTGQETMNDCLRNGINIFIHKPIDKNALKSLFEQLVCHKSASLISCINQHMIPKPIDKKVP